MTPGDVIRALEGSILPVQCAAEQAERRCMPCSREGACTARGVWQPVRSRLVETLDGITLADLQ
jgi:DNA-binding IscR family transcriptional regulator